MVKKAIRIFIIFAILALVINLVPQVYEWIKMAIEWVLSLGEWGVVILMAFVVEAILRS